ncbi:MAG: hypothetical protein JXA74_01335 [Anaerolineae bacterium]|nr:hypothetical protein [Anaerolineae bacterium]
MDSVYGWTGRLLRVDLTSRSVSQIATTDYVPDMIGGLGVAAALAWETLDPSVEAFDPENLLMIMTGPLTGTLASGGGRLVVAGIAPQQKPSVFSRSGMGGHWGAELKFAGYDGVVVVGQADAPVYLWICDEGVEIRDAGALWGRGTFATTESLRRLHGAKTRVIACGPAGEHRARIASLHTETGNAAGQGGYGALMGSKRLKAIAVRGAGGVRLAHPREFLQLCLGASREGFTPARHTPSIAERSGPNYRTRKCGFCMTPCSHRLYMDQPRQDGPGLTGSARQCYGFMTTHREDQSPRTLASDLGLNGWEVAYGIIPWLQMCKQQGLLQTLDGVDFPVSEKPIQYLRDVAPWPAELTRALLHKLAYREGELGDALADGACYAAERLFGGRGQDLLDPVYPRRAGQTEHWAGHWGPGGSVRWPFWLVPVLQWCVDTRDPASDSTHAYTVHVLHYLSENGPLPAEKVRAISARVFGHPDVGDPTLTYVPPEPKLLPAIWHHLRGVLIECLVLCDYEHARVFSTLSEDGQADTALMARLFSAATGYETSEAELDRASERVFQLLRAIDVRNHGRGRAVDEATLNAFRSPGKDDGVALDREAFLGLLDAYYARIGWNPAHGWPTRSRLEALGLGHVADGLQADGRLG